MKRSVAWVCAGVAMLSGAALADIPGVYCYGPGQCIPSAAAPGSNYSTDGFAGRGSQITFNTQRAGGQRTPQPTDPTYELYVVFANSSGGPTWSTNEKRLFADILNAFGHSDFWANMGAIYPDNPDMGLASHWPVAELVNCFSGTPPLHCATATYTPNGWPDYSLINNAVAGAQLPSDPLGIYIEVPAGSDTNFPSSNQAGPPGITTAYSIAPIRGYLAADCYQTTGSSPTTPDVPYYWSHAADGGTSHLNSGLGASPTGDCGLDELMLTTFEEIYNALPGWEAESASFPCGLGEPSCMGLSKFVGTQTNGAGNVYNLAAPDADAGTTYYALVPSLNYGAQGGLSGAGAPAPPSFWSTHCLTNADCPPFSNKCGSGLGLGAQAGDTRGNHCLPPLTSDGIKNGYEADTDCGMGAGAAGVIPLVGSPVCADGKECNVDTDCAYAPLAALGSCCVLGTCTAQVAPCAP